MSIIIKHPVVFSLVHAEHSRLGANNNCTGYLYKMTSLWLLLRAMWLKDTLGNHNRKNNHRENRVARKCSCWNKMFNHYRYTGGKISSESTQCFVLIKKNCVNVPPLSFVDDIIGISNCGPDAFKLNYLFSSYFYLFLYIFIYFYF